MSKKPNLKKEHQYPDELMFLPNPEKKFHEKWYEGRNMLNLVHPARILLLGGVNSGKSSIIIWNLIPRANPPFKEIYLYHCGGSTIPEYEDVDTITLDTIPEPTDDIFDNDVKKLIIIEDKEYKYMPKDELRRLDRLFGYCSTHRNTSIYCTGQYFFNLPVPVRNMTNVFILWKTKDLDTLKTIGRRVGLKKEEIYHLMQKYLTEPRDSLWIDNTFNTPYPLRKNGFEIIDKKENNID